MTNVALEWKISILYSRRMVPAKYDVFCYVWQHQCSKNEQAIWQPFFWQSSDMMQWKLLSAVQRFSVMAYWILSFNSIPDEGASKAVSVRSMEARGLHTKSGSLTAFTCHILWYLVSSENCWTWSIFGLSSSFLFATFQTCRNNESVVFRRQLCRFRSNHVVCSDMLDFFKNMHATLSCALHLIARFDF